jgi:hypothetical protein
VNTSAKRAALEHGLDRDWRPAVADALERRVIAIGACLRHLDDVHAIFEADHDHAAATEVRSAAGLLRDRAAGYTDQARALRAETRDGPPELLRGQG